MSQPLLPRASEPLAVVGAWCRLPGAADPDAYWDLIVNGRDATGELPTEILDRELYYSAEKGKVGRSYTTMGGLIPRLPIASEKCQLAESAIQNYDASHLVACEVASDAIRDAGYDPFALADKQIGVYLGHTGGTSLAGDLVFSMQIEETAEYLSGLAPLSGLSAGEVAAIASRISDRMRDKYDHRRQRPDLDLASHTAAQLIASAFDLRGPTVVVDAACASSLQALALASRALYQGSIDMAIVGGASCCKGDSLILFSAAQSVAEGKSCPFDVGANGLVTAEGNVTLVVKRLADAVASGDRIKGVIRSLGVSADGKGKSLWAPLEQGQQLAVQRAYQGGIPQDQIQYIEAHATSTQVGDATELQALSNSFPTTGRKIPLGSVKANIGHTLETAGLAGVMKILLAMRHQTIPPCANLRTPNPDICWDKFRLPLVAEPWPAPAPSAPRKAAVNAFGIGGLNVHVVMEEHLDSGGVTGSALHPRATPSSSATGPAVSPSGSAPAADSPAADSPAVDSPAVDSPEPIAVIGMGCVLPGARTVDQFWQLLESGSDPKSFVTAQRWDPRFVDPENRANLYRAHSGIGGFCSDYVYDWRKHRVPPKQIAAANPLQFMLLDAADQALRDARYVDDISDDVRERIGVIVGTSFGGDFSNQLQMGLRLPEVVRELRRELAQAGILADEADDVVQSYEDALLKKMPALIDETGSFTSSTLASRITKTFNLKGGALAMDAGEVTGLVTLSACIDVLRSGECDVMLCAAGQRCMDLSAFSHLAQRGHLASGHPEAAFGQSCDGIVPGEGTCVLVLKRLSEALRDGDDVRAVIREVSVVTDTKNPARALRRSADTAIRRSAANPDDVVLIESRGGVATLEEIEIRSLGQVFGVGRDKPLPVTSTVAQFGFLGAAHSLMSVMRAALSIERGHASPSCPPKMPRAGLFTGSGLGPQQANVCIDADSSASVIAVATCSESGTACTAILEPLGRPASMKPSKEKQQPGTLPVPNGPAADAKIIRVGATDWLGIVNQLEQHDASVLWQLDSGFRPHDRLRVAMVSCGPEELQHQCERLRELTSIADSKHRESLAADGIFVGQCAGPRSCLFSFPGQGSQYPGMLADLFAEDQTAADAMRQAEASLALLGQSSYRSMAGSDSKALDGNLWNTQASILIASWVTERAIRSAGLTPTAVFGHSFGEYAAIASASAWSITDALRAARLRAESVATMHGLDGRMLATDASWETLQRIVPELGNGIYAANFNGPDQIVLAGHRPLVELVGQRLKQDRHVAIALAVSCPFHTPLMQPAASLFASGFAQISLHEPIVPVISTASLGRMTAAETIAESLNRQLVTPVRYNEMIQAAMEFDPALVVEVGPKQVLTRLGKRIDKDSDTLWMATDRRGRSGRIAVLDVVAQAECLGCCEPISSSMPQSSSRPSKVARIGKIAFCDATQPRRDRMRRGTRTDANTQSIGGRAYDRSTNAHAPNRGSGDRNGSPNAPSDRASSNGRSSRDASPIAADGSPNGTARLVRPETATPATSLARDRSLAVDGEGTRITEGSKLTAPSVVATADALQTPDSAVEKTTPGDSELRSILIDFVVEQTGYPEEMVEFDADLESELGIDSIKKAQLFGELAGQFDIAPRDGMTLDDFATLGHILNFLADEISSSGSTDLVVAEPQGSVAPSAVQAGSTKTLLPDPLLSDPSRSVDPSAAPTLPSTHPVVQAAESPSPPDAAAKVTDEDLRLLLIDFVVEQTGYPEEMVEFEADLESELGIDSIKKAQLFGELAGQFDIAPKDGMTLDDFPTLGHILEFVAQELSGTETPDGALGSSDPMTDDPGLPTAEPIPATDQQVRATAPPTESNTDTSVLVVNTEQSDARRRGVEIGQALQHGIRSQLARVVDSFNQSDMQAEPSIFADELAGIAEGAEVNRSVVESLSRQWVGCDQLGVDRSENRSWSAQTPLAIIARSGNEIHRYLTGSVCGQLLVPMGVNSAGLAISCGPASVQPEAARSTVAPSPAPAEMERLAQRIHHLLGNCGSVHQASDALAGLKLSSPWQLLLSDASSTTPTQMLLDRGDRITVIQGADESLFWWHQALDRATGRLHFSPPDAEHPEELDLRALLGQFVISKADSDALAESPPCEVAADPAASANLPANSVMRRHVLRMVRQPTVDANGAVANGAVGAAGSGSLPKSVLVIGDGVQAKKQAALLGGHGIEVSRATLEIAATLEYFEALSSRPSCLLFTTALDRPHRPAEDLVAVDSFTQVLEVCRSYASRFEADGRSGTAAIVSLSKMNGDFGFSCGSERFVGGGLTGLLKGIRREYPEMFLKALDFAEAADSESMCRALIGEWLSGDSQLEVGFAGGDRFVVSAEAVPARDPVQVGRGGVWVVSGGGRGVTYVVARELAKRFGLRLHLIGTASVAGVDAAWRGLDEAGLKQWRKRTAVEARQAGRSPSEELARIDKQQELDANLRTLANDGVDATYHVCDLSDRQALAATLAEIRRQHGAISGVIHGAGVESACRLTRKKPELVRRTISSKCDGAANLMALTHDDPLEHFVAFGSTSGRFGGLGQADYSLASDLLAKMVGAYATRRPQTHCVCFHWPAWDDVGMAVRPESRLALEQGGLKFMPSREGVEHLIGELTAPSGDHEVLILDSPGLLDTDGTMSRSTPAEPFDRFSRADHTESPARTCPSVAVSDRRPLVGPIRRLDPGTYEAAVRLEPTVDAFLVDHRTGGVPLLPAVVTMEMFARTVQQIRPYSTITSLSKVSIGNGLRLSEPGPYECKIRAKRLGDDFRCELVGLRPGQSGNRGEFVFGSAIVHSGETGVAESIDVGDPVFGWTPFVYPPEAYLVHGPSLHTLVTLDFQHGGGRGNVLGTAKEDLFAGRDGAAIVPAAALDGCFFLCGIFGFAMLEKIDSLPYAIGSYRQFRQPRPAEVCAVRFTYRESNEIGPIYDFSLVGDSGDVVLEVKDYQTAQLRDAK